MAMFTVLTAAEVPPPRRRQSQYAIDLVQFVRALEEDQVLRVTPDAGRSLRGLQAGIGRILKREGIRVTTWDDGTHAYIARAKP